MAFCNSNQTWKSIQFTHKDIESKKLKKFAEVYTVGKFEIRSSKPVAIFLLDSKTATLTFSLELRTQRWNLGDIANIRSNWSMLCTHECVLGDPGITVSTEWKGSSHTERGVRGLQDQLCNCANSCHVVLKTCWIPVKETKLASPWSWPRPQCMLMSASACEQLGKKGAKGQAGAMWSESPPKLRLSTTPLKSVKMTNWNHFQRLISLSFCLISKWLAKRKVSYLLDLFEESKEQTQKTHGEHWFQSFIETLGQVWGLSTNWSL